MDFLEVLTKTFEESHTHCGFKILEIVNSIMTDIKNISRVKMGRGEGSGW